jgi:thiol-disulfide isomerase/thioredoxin
MVCKRGILLATCTLVIIVSIAGCGTGEPQGGNNSSPSQPTDVKLDPPDTKFDPVTKQVSYYSPIKVLDSNGNTVTLNANKSPIIFEAYWCPHCQRVLQELSHNRSQIQHVPTVVSMGFPQGTSLQQAVATTQDEFASLGITGFQVYYLLNPPRLNYVFPTSVFSNSGQDELLVGEHSLSVMTKAFGGAN